MPTNNGLPSAKAGPEIVRDARDADVARATENGVWVVRADVAGRAGDLVSWGSSAVVGPDGAVLREARSMTAELLVEEIAGGADVSAETRCS